MITQEINAYFKNLVPDDDFERLGTVFETSNKKYFYDTGTGKVLECSDLEYNLLENLVERNLSNFINSNNIDQVHTAFYNIKNAVEQENILQAPHYAKFEKAKKEDIKSTLNGSLKQMILEVTEQCNLRCKYCTFNEYNPSYRNFEKKNMSWDVAKKAIDFLNNHGAPDVTVAFYGGEPLLNFELMKKCIEYSINTIKDKILRFSFTSNLTLMTKEKAEYFASLEHCSILCSIDGPEVIHDAYRVTENNKGTYMLAKKGLENLIHAYGERAKDMIIINAVICPPYSQEKLNILHDYFADHLNIPSGVEIKYSYVEDGSLREEDIAWNLLSDEKQTDYHYKDFYPIDGWSLDNAINNDDTDFGEMLMRDDLVRMHNRLLLTHPRDVIRRNGCCIPGNQRLYVKVDGKFTLCEKIGNSPAIGDVDTGFYIDDIMEYYIDGYDQACIEECSKCWAVNHCGTCYASCYKEDGVDLVAKNKICKTIRKMTKGDLIKYYQLLEEKPDIIEKISKIELF